MSTQAPAFWPQISDQRIRFVPVYKGPGWLAVLKVNNPDDGLSEIETQSLLHMGFLKGSPGRFIYPKEPGSKVLEGVNDLFKGEMGVTEASQIVTLEPGKQLDLAIPDELRAGIAWWWGHHPQRMLNEIRMSVLDNDDEQAREIREALDDEQWRNPDRLKGWIEEALSGEITPVTEPILGLGLAKAFGVYKSSVPEELQDWAERLAGYRGESVPETVELRETEALSAELSAREAPAIGQVVSWGEINDVKQGRIISASADEPDSYWIAPFSPSFVDGIIWPKKERIRLADLHGFAPRVSSGPTSPEIITASPKVSERMIRARLSIEDIPSEEIRNLANNGLLNQHTIRLIRGIYKGGFIHGTNPVMADKHLGFDEMVHHWHFVRQHLGAELGGDTPEVRNATALLRDMIIDEFNESQPALPESIADVLAVIPIGTSQVVATDNLANPEMMEKLDRETVYGIGLHPRFAKKLKKHASDWLKGVDGSNDKILDRAAAEIFSGLHGSAISFQKLVPLHKELRLRTMGREFSESDPEKTDYSALVQKISMGRLFYSLEEATASLASRLAKGELNETLLANNQAVITSVMQLAGESHQKIEELPHPLFWMAEQIRNAGVLPNGSKAEILATLGIDLSASVETMGQLASIAGITLPLVNEERVSEKIDNAGLGLRADLIAGVIANKNEGARPFSIAIVATEPSLVPDGVTSRNHNAFPAIRLMEKEDFKTNVPTYIVQSLGHLVDLNRAAPLKVGLALNDNQVITNDALDSVEPNWFQIPRFTDIDESKRANNPVTGPGRVQPASSMPLLDSGVSTTTADIYNRLGALEKGLQALTGSWRNDEKARESLIASIQHWFDTHKHLKSLTPDSKTQIATKLTEKLIDDPAAEMLALLTRKSRSSLRYWHDVVTQQDIVEANYSRNEAAELAILKVKNRNPQYARWPIAIFDAMSALKPEALKYLNEQRMQAEKEAKATSENSGEPKRRGARQNKGLVAGLSIKDLRGNAESVMSHLRTASDLDQARLITKTRLWEAPDWVTLQAGGDNGTPMDPAVAAFWLELRKSVPSGSPVNVSSINLLYAKSVLLMRDSFRKNLTVSQLKDAIEGPFGDGIAELVEESKELSVKPSMIVGKRIHMSPRAELEYMLRRAISRTDNNKEWPRELTTKRAANRAGHKDLAGAMPALSKLVRNGAIDYRKGENTDEETLIRTFGFSGVEYGESMTQTERTTYLNHAYDGFSDLAKVLNVNPRSLSLGGTLGLAFGSRGRGGRRAALAHYEPSNNVINLTRMKGAGSMAHEYGHALSNYFSRKVSGQSRGGGDLAEAVAGSRQFKPLQAESIGELRKPIYDAFALIMAAATYDALDSETLVLHDFNQSYPNYSDMFNGARRADDSRKEPYWSSPQELFARSFETWVNEKLKKDDSSFRNDFLVRPDKLSFWGVPASEQKPGPGEKARVQLYPSGKQLATLDKAFSELVKVVKEGTKTVNHEHLGEIELPYLYSRDTGAIERLQSEDKGPMAQCVVAELARMCGPAVEVQWERELRDDHGNLVAGRFSVIEGERYKPGRGLRGLVELAHGSSMSVVWHESFHFAQEILLTPEERDMLNHEFAEGSELHSRLIDSLARDRKSHLIDACGDPLEAQAYAYQQWVDGSLDLKVEEQPRTLFGEIKQFFRNIFGLTNDAGFKKPESLFQAFYDGRLAARANLQAANEERWTENHSRRASMASLDDQDEGEGERVTVGQPSYS